jgi:competence protein ComEC
MPKFGVSTWKPFPFLRILLPLIAGILLQFYLQAGLLWFYISAATGLLLIAGAKQLSIPRLYSVRWLPGIGINFLFLGLGGILAIHNNIENDTGWVGKHYKEGDAVIVTIMEPLVDKPKSYKALARIESVISHEKTFEVKGDLLVYFQKDSLKPSLQYGSQLLTSKPLQPIRNSGNPGAFDYKRYCAFQDIHYQSFLKPGDFTVLATTKTNWLHRSLIATRAWVLDVLRKYIPGKNEVAVAEALLIGYRDDLDKELVQSYSNTGVVHIIAISGLHLGMIYGMLVWLFAPFKHRKWARIAKPIFILFVLWTFTFIAGAVPSILRSAVMFTCIVLGESLGKKTSIYNTLAASAFLLLLYNPFYLWDVGFQLSYTAVLSIIVFHKHVANWFWFGNKILSGIWKMTAISLAAQVLTLPVVLFHFHQFPNLFLLTNLIVVPLSGIILFAEIFLLILSFTPFLANYSGEAVEWMIGMMNALIERTDRLPFAVTDGIQVTILQSIFIYGCIIFASLWLFLKNKRMLVAAGLSLLGYVALRSIDMIRVNRQQKLIVYNIPQHTAIDIVEGDRYMFYGDSTLLEDDQLRNFHLRPSRIVNRVSAGPLSKVMAGKNIISSGNRKIVIVDQPVSTITPQEKIKADAIIITGNPRLYISQLAELYDCDLLVFDATNPLWKIQLWKKDCDSLHLRHYSVPEQGAFEMDL